MTFHFKMFYFMVIGFFTFCNCQRLIYNTTYCKNYRDIINIRNFPKYPPYAMSLSSSTYQAGQPITIEVLGCKSNGFRAFMLRAEIQGYVYRNPLDTDRTELGQIMISCGTGNYQNVRFYRCIAPFALNSQEVFLLQEKLGPLFFHTIL